MLNAPMREVPVNFDPTGVGFVPLRGVFETEPYQSFAPDQSEPSDPTTLGMWLKARGKGTIECRDGQHPTVELKMSGLIPIGGVSCIGTD